MAGKGPVPKGYSARESDQRRRQPQTIVTDDGEPLGRALPDAKSYGVDEWHPNTVRWYDNLRSSPMAKTWIATDFDFLIDTAILHHWYWVHPTHLAAAELRQRAAKMGATAEDRMRLKLTVTQPPIDETDAPGVTAINDYRNRLGEK